MKQRHINTTLTITALALATFLILTALPRAGAVAPTVASLSTNPKRINESAAAHSLTRSPFVDSTPGATHISTALRSNPVMFIENVGQFDDDGMSYTINWTYKSPIPKGRYAMGIAVLDGKIYSIGGFGGGTDYQDDTFVYDPITDTWMAKSPMPTVREYLGAAVVDGKIYAIGGDIYLTTPYATNEMYNPATNSWTTKAPMPTPRWNMGVVSVDDKIYVIGGETYAGGVKINVNVNEVYDPTTDYWATLAPRPVEGQCVAVALNGQIYTFGGGPQGAANYRYDPATDTWTARAPMPGNYCGNNAAVMNGKIYGGFMNGTYRYNHATDTWEVGTPTKLGRVKMGVIAVNDRIVTMGGQTWPGPNYVDTVEVGVVVDSPTADKPPVVLVHGHRIGPGITRCSDGVWEWEIGSDLPETFGEMALWLKEDGFDVWVAHYDTGLLGTPLLEKNAECLKDQIAYVRQVTGAQQVILVAHSMGGLVSRAYMEGPEYQSQTDVQALITLGSPHAGIPYNWLKFLSGPMLLPSVCKGHEGLCQLEEGRMEEWNQEHGPKSQEVAPLYYLIGGDKSDSFLGRNLRRWADPNDGIIGTRSAQAGTDGNPAIQGNVKGRYQTHESHSEGCCGYPSYFQPPFLDPTGQLRSQSYQCIQNVILDMSNPCAEPSGAAMLAQAVPSLTEYTSDVRGHLNTGETAEHTLQVDADGASLFYLSWMTGTLGITLTNPVGTVIDPAYAAANTDVVTYTTSPGSEMTPPFASYAFTTTVPGLYTATITAGDVGITGTDYLLFAAMETTRTLSVALDSDRYQIGDTAVLTATLEGAGAGITGATVQATFSRSDAITDTLTLTDQGDGTYRGTYAIPNVPGYLHLRVTAEGSDAGTQFNRQVDRLLTVASQAVQLTGTYADRADDADGNGRYETLTVDVEVLAAGAGDFTFSADLVDGGDQFVAHVITQTALITGTQSVPLSFDGDLIHEGESDGPFTVTNLLISDLQNAGIPSVMADDVWTTAAYDHTQFGRITGDMNGDCIVTVVDIMLVVSRWNTTIGDIRYDGLYDLDNSGKIDVADIMLVAAHWRETC